jgi:hypothetical protein
MLLGSIPKIKTYLWAGFLVQKTLYETVDMTVMGSVSRNQIRTEKNL